MSGITEGIRKRIRRIFMDRYKYTLSYDSRDQENAAVCAIMAALGNKRSAVIRALLMDAVRRYGADVFNCNQGQSSRKRRDSHSRQAKLGKG